MNRSRPRIGIVGAGHLGTSLAQILLSRGWSKDQLLLAHRGSPASVQALAALGLTDQTASVGAVVESEVVLLTVRPADVGALRGLRIPMRTVVVSCLAGITTATAQAVLGHAVVRALPSSPTSLEEGKGIAGVFPRHSDVETLLEQMGIGVHLLEKEEDFHAFTACLCLPAALMEWKRNGHPIPNDPLLGMDAGALPGLAELLAWAQAVTPQGLTDEEQRSYVTRMATPGGITEAMIRALAAPGASLATSFASGAARSRELAKTKG